MPKENNKARLGWREWVALPQLGITAIKAKVDTGARTSALHAFALDYYTENDIAMVRFSIHPYQRSTQQALTCKAKVIDERSVTDSGGHTEQRYVIETPIRIGEQEWPIEITLTNRDNMGFRMLLGRTAMRGRFVVDPGSSYITRSRSDSESETSSS